MAKRASSGARIRPPTPAEAEVPAEVSDPVLGPLGFVWHRGDVVESLADACRGGSKARIVGEASAFGHDVLEYRALVRARVLQSPLSLTQQAELYLLPGAPDDDDYFVAAMSFLKGARLPAGVVVASTPLEAEPGELGSLQARRLFNGSDLLPGLKAMGRATCSGAGKIVAAAFVRTPRLAEDEDEAEPLAAALRVKGTPTEVFAALRSGFSGFEAERDSAPREPEPEPKRVSVGPSFQAPSAPWMPMRPEDPRLRVYGERLDIVGREEMAMRLFSSRVGAAAERLARSSGFGDAKMTVRQVVERLADRAADEAAARYEQTLIRARKQAAGFGAFLGRPAPQRAAVDEPVVQKLPSSGAQKRRSRRGVGRVKPRSRATAPGRRVVPPPPD